MKYKITISKIHPETPEDRYPKTEDIYIQIFEGEIDLKAIIAAFNKDEK